MTLDPAFASGKPVFGEYNTTRAGRMDNASCRKDESSQRDSKDRSEGSRLSSSLRGLADSSGVASVLPSSPPPPLLVASLLCLPLPLCARNPGMKYPRFRATGAWVSI